MKTLKALAFISLTVALQSCGDDDKNKNNLFRIDTSDMKQQYQPQDPLNLSLVNEKKKEIDSVVYYINDVREGAVKGNEKLKVSLEGQKFGYQNLKALVFYDGNNAETEGRIELTSGIEPKLLQYEIVNTYPHDIHAYTQGLEFYRDTLFEGTGQYKHSSLRKVNYKTGEVYKEVKQENKYFGEGITVLNNKVYQLTWRETTGFIYSADTFEKIKEFTYFKKIEGWGLTNDGKYLYQSDGTEKIWKLDPETMEEADYVNVYTKNSKIKAVNELEWIEGKIYGNVYQKDAVAVINPTTGAVEAIIDFSQLKKLVTKHPKLDVLNGIAYNPKTKTIFVTGKNWDKMFEIKIKE
ncbi:glutaminyl-peptide cyclotransferase [Flavobacterium arcticum]|uniref:Glutaminyl-peptide cyclotransferase n=1 Tax=Flavobacterium arcticum TaxID=1784713 RepID=A0A345HFA6_9FLAO|nr:glutaminyl-peptide cyclotransferase [Flavobacterium arcticum]AXG75266.1 glutaminyl-peptide cyclotransferase [Flavobacterium arcticum]KAF2507590.1 glutaminyl-peptide cyclotransferase [Flavobacterium arcticum]